MRISDWSSDVCSADLYVCRPQRWTGLQKQLAGPQQRRSSGLEHGALLPLPCARTRMRLQKRFEMMRHNLEKRGVQAGDQNILLVNGKALFAMEHGSSSARPGLGLAIRRALMGRCPNCGQGNLFASYLKPVARCAICGEAYGHIRSDDAAPWLTILAVGIFGVPAILAVESHTTWPTWVSSVVWPLFGVGLALLLLPRLKAFLFSLFWFMLWPGSVTDFSTI